MRPSPVDIMTRTSHYESFTMIGTGYTLNKATMRPSPGVRAVVRGVEDRGAVRDVLCRGAWARVTIDQFRHSALQAG
jgi:hypothetical protein